MMESLENHFNRVIVNNPEFTDEQIDEYRISLMGIIDNMSKREMWSEVKVIQPDEALHVLENDLNKKNRKTLESHVSALTDSMSTDGRWTPTNASIAYDKNGKLVDGTHRFTACVRSNTSFETLVTYNVDAEVCGHHIDYVRARSISDKLRMMDIPANSSHTRIVDYMVAGLPQVVKTVFPDDKVTELNRYDGLIDDIVKLGNIPGVGVSGKAAFSRVAYIHGIGVVRDFVDYYNMKKPATTAFEQSPQVLRRRLIKWKEDMPRGNYGHEIAKQRRMEEYARVEFAMDKFISGETVYNSRATDVELFPIPTDEELF